VGYKAKKVHGYSGPQGEEGLNPASDASTGGKGEKMDAAVSASITGEREGGEERLGKKGFPTA